MLKRELIALICLISTVVLNVNAQNGIQVLINDSDFSINTNLTDYFDGQTPILHNYVPFNEPYYDTVYYVPNVYKDTLSIAKISFDTKKYHGALYTFKEQCYIMKLAPDSVASPHLTTKLGGVSSYNFIDIVATDNTTGDTIINSSHKVENQSGITFGFEDSWIGKLIKLEITTYGIFPEATNGEEYFTIQHTYENFADHYKMAFGILDTGYNKYTGVNNHLSTMSKDDGFVNVYDVSGHIIRAKVRKESCLNGLKKGIYIVDGGKVMVNDK
jgi:hypothetical protein